MKFLVKNMCAEEERIKIYSDAPRDTPHPQSIEIIDDGGVYTTGV